MNADSSDQSGLDPHHLKSVCLSTSLASLHLLLAASQSSKEPVFILDSGASSHMTPLRYVLVDVRPCEGTVSLGDMNVKLEIKAHGKSRMPGLGSFRWVPKLSFSLISVPALDRIGCRTVIYDGDLTVSLRGSIILEGKLKNGLYHLNREYVQQLTSDEDSDSSAESEAPEGEYAVTSQTSGLNGCGSAFYSPLPAIQTVLDLGSVKSPVPGIDTEGVI